MCELRRSRLLLSLTMSIATAALLTAQQATAPSWAGWIRCVVNAQAQGYSDQQTHTWILSGGTPNIEGVFTIYPATWSVVGSGSLQRTSQTSTTTGQWAINGQSSNAPIAVRGGNGRVFFSLRHGQLRAAGGITGYRRDIVGGKPQPTQQIAAEAYEWPLTAIEEASIPNISGSSTVSVAPSTAFSPQPGTTGTASCTWQFSQGSIAPAPPPTLTAQATPTPSTPLTPASPPSPTAAAPAAPVATPITPAPPPTAPVPAAPPTSPASPSSPGGAIADLSIFTLSAAYPVSTSVPQNGSARWDLQILNSGPSVVKGAMLTVPVSAGLSKTSVTCGAPGAAQCPAGLTVAQLENGVAIPNLSVGDVMLIQFVTTVTGAPGSSVTVTSTVSAPAGVSDSNPGNNSASQTVSVVAPASSSATPPPASPTTPANTPANAGATGNIVLGTCSRPGPTMRPSFATPGNAYLEWDPAPGAVSYTVSRSDIGLVTTTPITQVGPQGWVTFAHNAPLDPRITYRYTVEAQYAVGCGTSQTSVTPIAQTPTIVSVLSTDFQRVSTRGTVTLTWRAARADDATSFLILGPGLPQQGYELQLNGSHRQVYSYTITGVQAGTHTWLIAPAWDTPTGRMIDASTGLRATGTFSAVRVVVNGLRAVHNTLDSSTEIDGFGDEVYVAAAVYLGSRRDPADTRFLGVLKSSIHGDTSSYTNSRVQAGSATNTGGIRTGDVVPYIADPSVAYGTPSRTTFPFVLWEGWIGGDSELTVQPTVWEWDGGSKYFTWWETDRARRAVGVPAYFGSSPFWTASNFFGAHDRPIGEACDRRAVFGADGLRSQSPATARLLPAGTGMLRFADGDCGYAVTNWLGEYEVYLRVDTIP